MTVQSESAAFPLFRQPETRRPLTGLPDFILVPISRGKRAQRVGGWPPMPVRAGAAAFRIQHLSGP